MTNENFGSLQSQSNEVKEGRFSFVVGGIKKLEESNLNDFVKQTSLQVYCWRENEEGQFVLVKQTNHIFP